MRCIYCRKIVYGKQGMMVPNLGPAHTDCHKAIEASKRKFRNLDISSLSDDELGELKELVTAEFNVRRRMDDDIDLF